MNKAAQVSFEMSEMPKETLFLGPKKLCFLGLCISEHAQEPLVLDTRFLSPTTFRGRKKSTQPTAGLDSLANGLTEQDRGRLVKKVFFFNSSGERLAGVLHLPEKPANKAVIICHGFTGNKDANFIPKIASFLAGKGFAALRFDFSGNGESQGKFSQASHFKEVHDLYSAIKFVKGSGFSKIGLVGHSMGGAVVLLAAAGQKVSAVADICGPSKNEPARYKRYAWKWVRKRLSKKFFEDLKRVNIASAAKQIKAPLLIVHGSHDRTVRLEESVEIFKTASRPKKLVVVKKASHDFKGHYPKLFNTVSEWLKKWL